ncbi:CBS domain-containing protein [Peribacillus sp. SCS-155]|uniref:CBS domain-containing protein n=1 Tax=Peribacillus sedimenti TaxID=3115297 RepID=UPI003905A93C
MFVKSIMIPKYSCFTVQKEDSLATALSKLEKHQVDGLPVLDGEKYAGVVTRYGIYKHFFDTAADRDEYLQSTRASDIATHQDDVLVGDEIFEKTLINLKDFPILAVVDDDGKFLGIVSRSDVVETFQSAFGVNRPGVRIAFTSVETEGRIARLSEIAHHYHEHIISLVTFDETDKLVRRIVMKVEKKPNLDKFLKKLENAGFRILSLTED